MTGTVDEAWDCHTHVFGPYAQFPLAAERSYTPPEAIATEHQEMLTRLGFTHGVLVHPSAYGDDTSLLEHTLSMHSHLRGVVVTRDASLARLRALRERGVRAARFNHRGAAAANFAGSAAFEDLMRLAPTLADAGLHAELWTDTQVLPAIAAQVRALPVPVVIDHMGMFDAAAGVNDPGFQTLVSLVAEGKAWVKLCAYRNLLKLADPEAGRAFHTALLQANPENLIWGSDWPFLNVKPAPDPVDLLKLFERWTPDTQLRRRILTDNPRRLYD